MKLLSAILFITCIAITGCSETNTPPAVDFKAMPVEQKFVTVAIGKPVDASDPAVVRAKQLIERASISFKIPPIDVADQAYASYKIAKQEAIDATAEQILEAVTLAHVPGAKMAFSEYCAMYLTLRKSGHPHSETMMGLKGIISTLTAPAKK